MHCKVPFEILNLLFNLRTFASFHRIISQFTTMWMRERERDAHTKNGSQINFQELLSRFSSGHYFYTWTKPTAKHKHHKRRQTELTMPRTKTHLLVRYPFASCQSSSSDASLSHCMKNPCAIFIRYTYMVSRAQLRTFLFEPILSVEGKENHSPTTFRMGVIPYCSL